jgi:predicted GNAT superfamily acetyltransferase
MNIDIRFAESLEDFRWMEALQRQVWSGDLIVPLPMLTVVAHNGGVALGAWDGEAMVGFVFGFIGTDDAAWYAAEAHRPAMTRLKHCSHMLAVLPEYRDRGVGFKLKLAQRDVVLKQGIRLITWTFDPLESRNAHLNIARLGTVCNTYKRQVYGAMTDPLNAGLPSDRFQVDWWITSQRVKQRLGGERPGLSLQSFTAAHVPILNPTAPNAAGLPQMIENITEPFGALGLVEIPSDFQSLKAADLGLAREWKARIRSIFESAFEVGYIVTDFLHESVEGRPRSFYVLSQGEARLG